MEWSSEGLIIGVRRYGESALILEAMVPGRGRCLGLVRGGRSRRNAAFLQPGNSARLVWRARLEDHLGTFTAEATQLRAARLLADRPRLYMLQMLADHLRLLPERDPHDQLLEVALDLLDGERDLVQLGMDLARFELFLLEELGFGLDLASCAVSGRNDQLTHVSPRTGRAVSASEAEPYRDRLLPLPGFLRADVAAGAGDIASAFALTGHFLDRHVWAPRQIAPPTTRDWLVERLG
ncbi:DNA repair protein RecO [Pelagibacterium lacus]|uniref:DNA repair protein RecO n=1 Tax=Pelagibacterium lacus TaxID=2282655 RepID=A0A369WAA4_9HYPH|nr:DNA repair protein RecO [Pelagibacterium lacus]RDE08991.1 DNA repair protein RecO [Pelagibacterium lacus]